MKRIGFIGVGSIGAPMARCLLRGGYDLTVCDKQGAVLEGFQKMGAVVTQKPSDCADNEMVIIMVANDSQVREVVLGENGLLEAVNEENPPVFVIMSTVMPQTIHDLAGQCKMRGINVTDAPVSGMPVLAEEGKLTIFAGGEKGIVDRLLPAFGKMAKSIHHTGGLGTGEITKIINNIYGLSNLFLTVEAMRIAKNHGMDPKKLAAIYETSTARNFYTGNWDKAVEIFRFFSQNLELSTVLVDITEKDLVYAQQLAEEADISCPLLDHIVQAAESMAPDEIKEQWNAID